MTTEKALQTRILEYLKTQPHTFAFKTIKTNQAGIPDIIIVYRGAFIFIEVKSPSRKSKATPLQSLVMTALRLAGAQGFITNDYPAFLESYRKLTMGIDASLKT